MQVTIDQARARARLAIAGDRMTENYRLRQELASVKADNSILRGKVADLERERDLLVCRLETDLPKLPTMQAVVNSASKIFSVSQLEIIGPCRHPQRVKARHIAMYIIKTETICSYPQIGRFFGGRDHTTVMHAIDKIERMVAADEKFAAIVQRVKEGANGQA